ncbi:hypothetical protein GGI12_002490 [Dipsacomyces acuminosporus]|nr:hypothetical protein GGI12_002490 [Dipsacomyces acuminosporus]
MSPYLLRPSMLHFALAVFVLAAISSMLLLLTYPNAASFEDSLPPAYTDALNRTLGFHKIYVTHDAAGGSRDNVESIAKLLGLELTFVQRTAGLQAKALRVQHGYLADVEDTAELLTHMQIYADMARSNIQSALILSSDVDVELDLKMRLAAAMSGHISDTYDILFVGRTHSEAAEPGVQSLKTQLREIKNITDSSVSRCQQHWTKEAFLSRRPCAFRTSFPRGAAHAYAISGRMARRLNRRMHGRMASDAHGLEYILADAAMVGLSIAYSLSPPPVTRFSTDRIVDFSQHLSQSALYVMSIRSDNPASSPPYEDLSDMWAQY